MKKNTLFVLLLLVMHAAQTQNVGINNDGSAPDASAILDIKSNTKGLLIPRMSFDERTSITSPATSLLVYQTDGAIGFYYNAGTSASPNWLQLSSSINAWGLTGNSGTNPSANFIGTIDNQPLVFRMNSVLSGKIDRNSNTSLGYQSAAAITGGFANSFFGHQAGFNNTAGYRNTGIGVQALQGNIAGSHNTALGVSSLFANTDGHYNTAVGYNTLASNTTGSNNTASGVNALFSNTSGTYNIATGPSALHRNTTGFYNNAYGPFALYNNTTGNNNIGIAAHSLYNNSIGSDNIAMGAYALYSNTTGNNNIAAGGYALTNNTYGIKNIAIGYEALSSNIYRSFNIAMGDGALKLCNDGDFNIAIGLRALAQNTGGRHNIAIGHDIGYGAVSGESTGSYNVTLGSWAMALNSSGNNNTTVGFHANSLNTTGSNNTAIGFEAQCGGNSTGFSSDPSSALNNATAIGANAEVDQDNSMVLGGIQGINHAPATIKVGIGTTRPAARLHIKSNSSPGAVNSQLMLEEDGDDFARITLKNNVSVSRFWDIAGYTHGTNSSARLNFYYHGFGDVLSLNGNGNATLSGTLTQLSDARLKKNIAPIGSSLRNLAKLNGYRYQWKNENMDQSMQIGLLAQEVQQVFPELVKKLENGNLSVNYMGLVPVLINAVKEQQSTIESLERRLAALEEKMKKL